MALLDFLTEGTPIPAGSAPVAKTTTSSLPDWYSNFAMDILAGQKNLSTADYVKYQPPRVAEFTPTERAGMTATVNAAGVGAPIIQRGLSAAEGLVGKSGLSAAQPYLTAAGTPSYANVSSYMNPYNEAVVNRIGELGARTLREQLLPQISDRFIGAGQFGSSRNAEMIGRSLRDIYESTLAEQSKALQGGYTGALSAAEADLQRQGQLASTAGNLGTAEVTSGLDVAKTIADLGTTAQTSGLTGAKAITDVGATERAMDQKNLDVAYADFLRQQGFPQEQIDKALETFKGIAGAVPKATTEVGVEPYNQQYTPSPLATGISTLAAGAGIAKDLADAGLKLF